MKYNIALIPGDGIGPDIIEQAVLVLEKIGKIYNHEFKFIEVLAGGCAIDKIDTPLPEETLEICKNSDAVLLGALGGPKWDNLPGDMRPEKALLGLRKGLKLYANIRPVVLYNELKDACPLKSSIIEDGIDLCIVRELTGGIYFGDKGRKQGEYGEEAFDIKIYNESEIERILKIAFETAKKRNRKVTSIDKANVLESSRLWRKVAERVAEDYPDINLEHMFVDNGAMQIIRDPKQFDVIVTGNMFGDILSDEASVISGSIGMLPSASLGDGNIGMYEPIHGSAPDIAGKDIANPLATILSTAMMLKYSFNLIEEANMIEKAVESVLKNGYRTADIMQEGKKLVGTEEMGKLILQYIGG